MNKNKILWEDAIIEIVKKCGGVATLRELYQHVAKVREATPGTDINHIIRAYLRRMTRVSGKLKRVGLGIYALPDVELGRSLFEDIQKGKTKKEIFKGVREDDLHFHVEGMLIELGNIYGYLTYTADRSRIFNNKPLDKLATLEEFPHFTSAPLLDVARTIDVIWFKKGALVAMPKHTFDVEITTDFSKALHRAYQLRDFRTTFYVVGLINKYDRFQKRLTTDPYQEISGRIFFRSIEDIFSLYETAVRHFELREKIIIEQ